MKFIKFILLIACLYAAMCATAQTAPQQVPASNINKKDPAGKRHGTWVLTQGERMGEAGFTEFGSYEHGKKVGAWYKLGEDREIIANELYRNDVKDGESKYYEKGRMIAVGKYRGLNPAHELDTFYVENPITGAESLVTVPTERGSVKDGLWRFYDLNGQLIREEEYQLDEIVFKREFPLSKEDSLYYQKRAERMPHGKKKIYKPAASKQVRY